MRIPSAAAVVITLVPVLAAAQQFQTTPPGTPVDPNTRFDVVAIKPIVVIDRFEKPTFD